MRKLFLILLLCRICQGYVADKPLLGISLNGDHDLSRELVGVWLFNDRPGVVGKTYDLSGNGYDMTLVGAADSVSGRFGNALNFNGDGSGDYATTPSAVVTGPPCTFVCWARPDTLAENENRMVTVTVDGASTDVLGILLDGPSDKLQVQHYDGDGDGAFSTKTMVANQWHHCVGVFVSDSSRIAYLDGVAGPENTDVQDALTGLDVTDIGALSWTGGRIQEWAGQIDNVTIYDRALSASEIAQLYANPFSMFEQERLPIATAAAPPSGGQVIVITSMIPLWIILILAISLVYSKRRAA